MYSVVLMMALTGGGDVPAGMFNHGCCGGGHGCSGCYGCMGGCYGSCHGGKHHRSQGCCGGCYGGCYGNSYGCCGGGRKHHRSKGCCGGCYGGCYGSSCYGGCYGGGYGGCYGGGYGGMGTPMVPGMMVPAAPATPAKPATKKSSLENAAPATLIVTVPADARLSIDGESTTSTSTERVFVSPALTFGREYHYTLQAEFQKDGKTVKVRKDVAITAGNETRVSFVAESLATVASR
ncbi:MAG: TIGR03000 domain-containing protein [Gemmataceae bacterium]